MNTADVSHVTGRLRRDYLQLIAAEHLEKSTRQSSRQNAFSTLCQYFLEGSGSLCK